MVLQAIRVNAASTHICSSKRVFRGLVPIATVIWFRGRWIDLPLPPSKGK